MQTFCQGLPPYLDEVMRGYAFSAGNQAAQAVSVALNTTYTGLCLFNPTTSKVLLVPTFVKYALSVAPAGIATLGLIQGGSAASAGVTAQTSKLTPRSNQIGVTATPTGIVCDQATITTPTWVCELWDGFTAGALPNPTGPVDLKGLFVIYPGGFLAIGALTAVTGLGSISWLEIPND